MRKLMSFRFDYVEFAKCVMQARKGRGLSQASLGQVIGKTRATISRYEANKVCPEIGEFLALCFFLDLDPMHFFLVQDEAIKTAQMFNELRKAG